MIAIVILIGLIAASLIPFSTLLFELTAAVILFIPIEAFLLGKVIAPSPLLYGSLLLFNIGIVYLVVPRSKSHIRFADAAPLILWMLTFVVALAFCHRWPDFMSMGERIRDYALLAEVMKYPFTANEPWMTGENLNYYLYWYRFGSFLGNLLGIPVWEMYHILQSVTFSLFITTIFQILHRLGGFSIINSSLSAIIIGVGSNIEGIKYFLKGDENWWGPSRVIPGAINEFPAWSFLLGDLHPHYLNLTLFPLIVLFIHALWSKDAPFSSAVRITIFCLTVGPLWIYNSNAWEVPVLGIYFGFLILFALYTFVNRTNRFEFNETHQLKGTIRFITVALVGAGSLYLSSRNITTGGDVFRTVRPPVALTTVAEIVRHWGLPLGLISLATIGLYRDWMFRGIIALSLAASLLVSPAIAWISFLIAFTLIRVFIEDKESERTLPMILIEAMGLLSLALLFIPEVFFLDDPYGGENERMNTIFKAYSANWALLHMYAFYLFAKLWRKFTVPVKIKRFAPTLALCCLCYFSLGFFHLTQNVRKSNDFHISPITQGLSQLDTKYPGAAEALKAFVARPDGITLEAQGNPYSMTSHVSTLAGKRSYLGWMNHVDLLTRKYDESKRRAALTTEIYTIGSCEDVKRIIETESIRYIVVGPLERETFQELTLDRFACFSKIIDNQSYTIFEHTP